MHKKSKGIKLFILGLTLGVLMSIGVTAFANSVISSAVFNNNKVIFNGTELDLDMQLISVTLDGQTNVINYMPVRAILEGMGYTVGWDSVNNAVLVNSGQATVVPEQPTVQSTSVQDLMFDNTNPGATTTGASGGGSAAASATFIPGNIVYRGGPSSRFAMTSHNLSGRFNTFTAQISHVAHSRTSDITFTFIGDGRTLETISRTAGQPLPYDISVDVTGVNVFVIEANFIDNSFGPSNARNDNSNPIGIQTTGSSGIKCN